MTFSFSYCTRCDESGNEKVLIFQRFKDPIPAMPAFGLEECTGVRVEVCRECVLPTDEVVT